MFTGNCPPPSKIFSVKNKSYLTMLSRFFFLLNFFFNWYSFKIHPGLFFQLDFLTNFHTPTLFKKQGISFYFWNFPVLSGARGRPWRGLRPRLISNAPHPLGPRPGTIFRPRPRRGLHPGKIFRPRPRRGQGPGRPG